MKVSYQVQWLDKPLDDEVDNGVEPWAFCMEATTAKGAKEVLRLLRTLTKETNPNNQYRLVKITEKVLTAWLKPETI